MADMDLERARAHRLRSWPDTEHHADGCLGCQLLDERLAAEFRAVRLEEAMWWRDSYSQVDPNERMKAYNSRQVRIAELEAK